MIKFYNIKINNILKIKIINKKQNKLLIDLMNIINNILMLLKMVHSFLIKLILN